MSSEDTFAVHIGIVLLGITIVARESLFGVRDVQTSVGSTFECAKDTASGGGGFASYVKEGAEGALVLVDFVYKVGGFTHFGFDNISINFGVAFVHIVKANLLEETTSTEESGAVGGGVVLKTDLESVAGELVRTGRGQDAISIDERVDNLANDLLVGETNDEAVFGRLVFVLGLAAETLALTVVGAAFATTAKFDLEAFVVRFGLGYFDKHLRMKEESCLVSML
jgi:hypothetical protein